MDGTYRCEAILVSFRPDGIMNMYLDSPPKPNRIYEVCITSRYPTGREKVNVYRPDFDDHGFAELAPYNAFCCPAALVCTSWQNKSSDEAASKTSDNEEE